MTYSKGAPGEVMLDGTVSDPVACPSMLLSRFSEMNPLSEFDQRGAQSPSRPHVNGAPLAHDCQRVLWVGAAPRRAGPSYATLEWRSGTARNGRHGERLGDRRRHAWRETRAELRRRRRGARSQELSSFSMAPTTSSETGAVEGEKRATTSPDRSTRNLAKFHWMSPGPSGPVGDCVRNSYSG